MAVLWRFLSVYFVSCALMVAAVAFLLTGLGTDMVEVGRWMRSRPEPHVARSVRLPDAAAAPAVAVGAFEAPADRVAHSGRELAGR